jgi:Ca2+-binding RTX toxin-like protein
MTSRRGKGILALAACATCGLLAAPAQATFHLNKIREISGSTAGTDSAYIELQMYAAGENLVSGHNITFWDQDGLLLGIAQPIQTLPLTGPNPPNGQNQRTILIGDTGVPNRDFTLDFTPYIETGGGGGNNLIAAGAACYEGIPVDCVSWGQTFTGANNLPDKSTPIGQPMTTTGAYRRSIAKGCATLLEASDDTNNNQNDFAPVPRAPRPNSAAPVEKECGAGSGGTKPPPGSNFKCQGKKATLIGSADKDNIKGTGKRDVIVAFGGNDTVKGGGGNDVLCGNGGKDKLVGGKGKDLLVGGPKADKLIGGAGKDTLSGQGGKDTCNGGPGSDTEKSCGGASTSAPIPGPVY